MKPPNPPNMYSLLDQETKPNAYLGAGESAGIIFVHFRVARSMLHISPRTPANWSLWPLHDLTVPVSLSLCL